MEACRPDESSQDFDGGIASHKPQRVLRLEFPYLQGLKCVRNKPQLEIMHWGNRSRAPTLGHSSTTANAIDLGLKRKAQESSNEDDKPEKADAFPSQRSNDSGDDIRPYQDFEPKQYPPPEIGAIALIGIALSRRQQIPDVSSRRHGYADQDYADPKKFEPGCKRLQHGSDQVGETARFTANVHLSILCNKLKALTSSCCQLGSAPDVLAKRATPAMMAGRLKAAAGMNI